MNKVLIAGATGFFGKRLVLSLLEEGHEVYALVRTKGIYFQNQGHPNLHLVYGEVGPSSDTNLFPEEIEVVYYLMHSLARTDQSLIAEEVAVAEGFMGSQKKARGYC